MAARKSFDKRFYSLPVKSVVFSGRNDRSGGNNRLLSLGMCVCVCVCAEEGI